MDPSNAPGLTPRTRRAVALIVASLTVIVVASLLYLNPKTGGPPPQPMARPSPTAPLLVGPYITNYAFVTPSVGWAVVVNLPEQTPFWIFKTTDGAKHWVKQYTGDRGGVWPPERPDSIFRPHARRRDRWPWRHIANFRRRR